jgi:hypothetical protein
VKGESNARKDNRCPAREAEHRSRSCNWHSCRACSGTLSVSCTTFELAGVGHTNATLATSATYSATIDCFNPAGQLVESHETSFTQVSTARLTSSKNGRLRVPAVSVSPDTSVAELCPNPLWTPTIRAGTLTLTSFTYTLTFDGFTGHTSRSPARDGSEPLERESRNDAEGAAWPPRVSLEPANGSST